MGLKRDDVLDCKVNHEALLLKSDKVASRAMEYAVDDGSTSTGIVSPDAQTYRSGS